MKTQQKGEYKVVAKRIVMFFLVLVCLVLIENRTFGAMSEPSEMEKQEYRQERARIKALRKSLTPGPTNNIKEYEKFADEIQSKWSRRNKEHKARLMLEVCKPLSSGYFKDDRRYDLARKYALSVLETPDEIPLTLELELIGHTITLMIGPNAPKDRMWERLRRKDVEIRLHAWERLIEAIDPKWDPNEILFTDNAIAADMGFPYTIASGTIEDPNLRAAYEAALEANQKKNERYIEQNRLHKWLKRFPRHAEPYLIQAYSKPPFNNKELKQYLDKYVADKETRDSILAAVIRNMEKKTN